MENYEIEGPAIYAPSLGETYRVSGYPTVYVLNGDREIVAAHSGEAPGGAAVSLRGGALGSPGVARLAIDSGGARG